MVLQPPEPTITISGPQHIARTVDNIQAGILPFTGVTVVSLMSEEMEEEEDRILKGKDSVYYLVGIRKYYVDHLFTPFCTELYEIGIHKL